MRRFAVVTSIWPLAVLAGLIMVPGTRSAVAAEAPATIVIVDGSGSMWNTLPGERLKKFYMVREAMKLVMGKVGKDHRVGLASFGHRRRSDCGDIEMLIDPAAQNAARVGSALEKLGPRGKGPLTGALREAAGVLGAMTGPRSIILVHDDIDNCQADVCAAADEIARTSPGLKVHLISAGLRKEDVQAMSCVPRATGGRAFTVANLAQTRAALEFLLIDGGDASPTASGPVPPPAAKSPAPPTTAATAIARPRPNASGLMLTARMGLGQPELAAVVSWRVLGEDGTLVHESSAVSPFVALPSGRYKIEGRYGHATGTVDAEVAEASPVDADIILDAGTLRAKPKAQPASSGPDQTLTTVWKSSGPEDAKLSAVDLGQPLVMVQGLQWELTLPVGRYVVAVETGPQRVAATIEMVAGSRVDLDPQMTVGELQLSAVAKEGGVPIAGALFLVYRDDPDAPLGRREIARSAAMQPVMSLPAGAYSVAVRLGPSEFRERVFLRAGESQRRAVVLNSGKLTLSSRIVGTEVPPNPALVSYRIERLDVSPPEISLTTNAVPTFELGAGRYRIEGRLGAHNVVGVRTIELKPGSEQTLTIEHQAVIARLRFVDNAGNAFPDVIWDVFDPAGKPVLTTGQAEPISALAAGRYTLRVEHRGRRSEHTIELRSGESRVVDIVAPN